MIKDVYQVNETNTNYFKFEKMKRILYPLRLCTKDDYTSRGVNVTDEFVNNLKYRLCPDIS